jgi:hypothetical protein
LKFKTGSGAAQGSPGRWPEQDGCGRYSPLATAGCGGRGCAEDERCGSRTAKACGCAPTLASSFVQARKAEREAMVANKHWLTKESTQ